MAVPEPATVYPEAAFQSAVVSVVEVRTENRRFALMQRFGLDVAVFLDASPATVRLLEVKAFNAQRMGGVGLGNGRGIGPQVDLLLFGEDSLCLFDSIVRRVYADATLTLGTPRYGLFTCDTAKKAAMAHRARKAEQSPSLCLTVRPRRLDAGLDQVKGFLLA